MLTAVALLVVAPQYMTMREMIDYSHAHGISDTEIVIALGVLAYQKETGNMPNLQPRKARRKK